MKRIALAICAITLLAIGCAGTLGKVVVTETAEQTKTECKGIGVSLGKATACGTTSDHIGAGASQLIQGVLCSAANAWSKGSCVPETRGEDEGETD